ncbi:7815_t:CDS:2 [Ambispora leptoticha]|uniref:7815_t:CDS:1 n=1 Tax=Ambispora leptoticha TaxID=144679 RepID=A0A9N8WIF4_9GLOM|nr:7815_t:CDS:2 [Ambispora leptoticha]
MIIIGVLIVRGRLSGLCWRLFFYRARLEPTRKRKMQRQYVITSIIKKYRRNLFRASVVSHESLKNKFQKNQGDSLKKQPKQIKQFIRRPWRSKIDILIFPNNNDNKSTFPVKEKEKNHKQIFNKTETTTKKSTIINLTQIPVHISKKNTLHGFFLEIKQQAITAFMPKGYPDSVTHNYWNFAKWQFVHNVAGAVTGAAALNWIIKDGLGQLGGVIYAAIMSDRFDSEPKRHRFQSTVAMQLASILELMTPLWPNMFLLIASISNIGKNIAWLAGSATRAQMHKTFALRDNLGDLTGKSGSQTTAAGLLGTGVGIVLSTAITALSTSATPFITIDSISSTTLPVLYIFVAFMPFSALNIYANYQSSLYVTNSTLNVPRAEMIFHDVLLQHSPFSPLEWCPKISVSTPREISVREVFVRRYRSKFNIPIVIEPALHHYPCEKYDKELYSAFQQEGFKHHEEYFLLHVFDEHYIFGKKPLSPFQYFSNSKMKSSEKIDALWKGPDFQLALKNIRQQQHIALWFSQRAKPKDMIKGFAHACAFRFSLDKKIQEKLEHKDPEKVFSYRDREQVTKVVAETYDWVDKVSEELFEELLAKKWDIEYLFFAEGEDGRLFVER